MHKCIFCNKECDCNYEGQELEEGEDSLCTGCHICEEDFRENNTKEADDYGSTDYM